MTSAHTPPLQAADGTAGVTSSTEPAGGETPTTGPVGRMVVELKAVTWPTRAQFLSYTGSVIAFLVIATALVGLTDTALSAAILALLG